MPALLELAPLASFLLALAFVLLVEAIVKGLFKPLFSLPVVGGAIEGLLSPLYQSITNALGSAVSGLEKLIGASWHQLSRQMDWLWREIKAHAVLILSIATPLGLVLGAVRGIRALVHRLTAANTHSGARLKAIDRELARLQHRERVLEHDLAKGIGEDVLPRIKSLDREIAKIRTQTIPAIEAADAQSASAISDLWTWIHKNVLVAGTTAFVGAVAVALSALGLGGLRCPGFLRLLNNRGCGLGGLLDSLLGLVISALALENICTLLPILETAFGDVVGPVTHLLTEVPIGGCETPPKSWATLSVAAGPLPPSQTLGSLPV